MTEERSRVAQFFNFYRPCVEQEITLVSEIENLQSILDETTKQCSDPLQLPPISEDLIVGYKVSETWLPGSREPSTGLVSEEYFQVIFIATVSIVPACIPFFISSN